MRSQVLWRCCKVGQLRSSVNAVTLVFQSYFWWTKRAALLWTFSSRRVFLSAWGLQAVEANPSQGLTNILYAMDLHLCASMCQHLERCQHLGRCWHMTTHLGANTCDTNHVPTPVIYQSYGLNLDAGMCWHVSAPEKVPAPGKVPARAGMCRHI